ASEQLQNISPRSIRAQLNFAAKEIALRVKLPEMKNSLTPDRINALNLEKQRVEAANERFKADITAANERSLARLKVEIRLAQMEEKNQRRVYEKVRSI